HFDGENRREATAGTAARPHPAGGRPGHARVGAGARAQLPGGEGAVAARQGRRARPPGVGAEVPVPGQRLQLRAGHRRAQPHDHRRFALLTPAAPAIVPRSGPCETVGFSRSATNRAKRLRTSFRTSSWSTTPAGRSTARASPTIPPTR